MRSIPCCLKPFFYINLDQNSYFVGIYTQKSDQFCLKEEAPIQSNLLGFSAGQKISTQNPLLLNLKTPVDKTHKLFLIKPSMLNYIEGAF